MSQKAPEERRNEPVLGTHIGPMGEMPQLVSEYLCRYPRRYQSEVRTEEVEPGSGGGVKVVASNVRIHAIQISVTFRVTSA